MTDIFGEPTSLPTDETEFGGTLGLVHPASRGYVPKPYEEMSRMFKTDPADVASGADITSQRVV